MKAPVIRLGLRHAPSPGVRFVEPSLTQQHFKDECDIDKILKRYEQTGFLVDPMAPKRPAQFGDFSEIGSYQETLNRVNAIEDWFMSLPSAVRRAYENDPAKLADALSTEEGRKAFEDQFVRDVKKIPPEAPAASPEPAKAGE